MSMTGLGDGTFTSVYPSKAVQAITLTAFLLAISLVSCIIGLRWPNTKATFQACDFSSSLWLARLMMVIVFFDSWLFLIVEGVLQYGVGLSSGSDICHGSILLCVMAYALSKLGIFLFLAFRVFTVSSGLGESMIRSPRFLFNLFLIFLSVGVLVGMILGHTFRIDADGMCHIGLERHAVLPLLAWDVVTSAALASQFAFGLLRSSYTSSRHRRVAIRSLVLGLIAMISTGANLISMCIVSSEPAFLCLTVCSVDIMICSLALSWTSDSRDDEHRSSLHLHSNVFLGSKDATADLAEDPVPRLLFDEHGQVKSDRRSVAMAAGWLEDQRRRANSLEVSAPTIAVVDLSARDKDEDAIDRAL